MDDLIDSVRSLLAVKHAARELPVGAECRRIRQSAGVSSGEIARLVGVSRQAVWNWESGRGRPSALVADRYMRVLRELASAR